MQNITAIVGIVAIAVAALLIIGAEAKDIAMIGISALGGIIGGVEIGKRMAKSPETEAK